jgi:hypothetical protein
MTREWSLAPCSILPWLLHVTDNVILSPKAFSNEALLLLLWLVLASLGIVKLKAAFGYGISRGRPFLHD